jgi:hypothetical protein
MICVKSSMTSAAAGPSLAWRVRSASQADRARRPDRSDHDHDRGEPPSGERDPPPLERPTLLECCQHWRKRSAARRGCRRRPVGGRCGRRGSLLARPIRGNGVRLSLQLGAAGVGWDVSSAIDGSILAVARRRRRPSRPGHGTIRRTRTSGRRPSPPSTAGQARP